MYQVDCEDANFLFLERAESPTHISLFHIYDQSDLGDSFIRFKQIQEHIRGRLNSTRVFRQKIRFTPANIDYPYWEDDEQFELNFHLRHLALPKPGDWRQFCIQVSRLHSRPLDLTRPPWEMYVIEGLDNFEGYPPNCFALYFKVHHCAMDEFTAQELMQSLNAETARARKQKSSVQYIAHLPARVPSAPEMVLRGVFNNAVKSVKLGVQAASNLGILSRAATKFSIRLAHRLIDGEPISGNVVTRFARPLSQQRVVDGGFFPKRIVDDFAKEVPGATPTHVLLMICGEAMRTYLEQHDELGELPLHALLEINVRNAGAHALAGNHIAINQIDLNIQIQHAVDRLQAIYLTHEELNSVENAEMTSFKLRSLYENLPAPIHAWLGKNSDRKTSLNRRLMEIASCGVTEMAGVPKPLYFLGARLRGFSSVPPLYSGCGLMFTASSYCDEICITFTSDRKIMPDPEVMREHLNNAVFNLEKYIDSPVDFIAESNG